MFKNYLKISIRNLIKHKTYSIINILGLTIGIACAILILLWIRDELSMDNYHEKRNSIYQAYLKGIQGENINLQSTTSPAIARRLKTEFPEVVETGRTISIGDMAVKYKEKILIEPYGFAADPSILNIFSYEFLNGDPQTALSDPYSLVLTQSTAQKYFGDENPINEYLTLNNCYNFKVTGVIKDLPLNTYRKFDYLVPLVFMKELGLDIDGSDFYPCSYFNYAILEKNADYKALNQKIKNTIFSQGKEITFEITLLPLKEVYLSETGGKGKLYIFSFIAFIILLTASINFTNLATARAITRTKEIGIRKVTGANRTHLISQFFGESLLLTVISAIIAVVLADFLLSYFNTLTGKAITIKYLDFQFIIGLISIILLTGLFAGSYPALFLSSFNPITVFKPGFKISSGRAALRKTLIIVQFVFSVFFIVCTITMSRQTKYIRNFDLGINKNNIFYVAMEGDIRNKYDAVKQELLQSPNIKYVSTASNLPIAIRSGSYFQWGINDDHPRRICQIQVDYDFLETFELHMAEGRFYSKDFTTDTNDAVIVNQTAINKVGLESPTNKPFYFANRYLNLIGVVEDFMHNSPLNTSTEPLAIFLEPKGNNYLFVKINPAIKDIHTISETVNFIKSTCQKFSPDRPLYSEFLSHFSFDRENLIEAQSKLILLSTILAILISCLGLFGLSSFITEQRTKEIGIRKVVGATVPNVVILLTRNSTYWIIISYIIASPIAYFAMNKWLQNFAFRVKISWEIFLLTGLLSLMIAIITVSYHAVRIAISNPIDALKYE